MKIFVRLLILLQLVFLASCYQPNINHGTVIPDFVNWQKFDNQIVWYSMTARAPILLYFYSDNCINCDKVSNNLFKNENIVLYINQNFAPARLNTRSEDTRRLMRELGVQQTPAIVILSHVDRSVLFKVTGVPTPVMFFNSLKLSLQMDNIKSVQGVLLRNEYE